MNVSRWFFAPRSKDDWKSWRSLVITFPFIIGVFLVAPQAMRENTAATRQQTSQGIVTAYEPYNHNECSYTFTANGRLYSGIRSAATTDVRVGDRVLVYYDSQDPTVNALEDFSEMSHNDRGLFRRDPAVCHRCFRSRHLLFKVNNPPEGCLPANCLKMAIAPAPRPCPKRSYCLGVQTDPPPAVVVSLS
jgi:hypothetical protein